MRERDPLSLRQIAVFVALIDQRSFTKAAQSLGLSQSTVSGHIADLEQRLGARLVERERGGVRPTSAGSALIRPAREMLQAERNARMAIDEHAGLIHGELRIGASTIPASYILPELLGRFHESHANIRLTVETGDSGEITERVQNADLEIGVVGFAPNHAAVHAHAVARDRLVLVVGGNHPLKKSRIDATELAELEFVMREKGSGTRAAAQQALNELLGDAAGALRVRCHVGSTEAQRAAVRAGLGAALISSLAASNDVAQKSIREIKVKGLDVTREFFLITRADNHLSPAARALRDLASR